MRAQSFTDPVKRGRRPKLRKEGRSDYQRTMDEFRIAAAVESFRRRFKPLRDKGHRSRVGAYRLVAEGILGGRVKHDTVETIYKRNRHHVQSLKSDWLVGCVDDLVREFSPAPPESLPFAPDGDRPPENPRHARWLARNRLKRVG